MGRVTRLNTLNTLKINIRRQNRREYGYVYFYRDRHSLPRYVKIGRSKQPLRRLKAQRTALPKGLKVIGVIRVKNEVRAERLIHNHFQHLRVSPDNEWFSLTPGLLWYILRIRNKKLTDRLNHELLYRGRNT